jgi:hypothetical protein
MTDERELRASSDKMMAMLQQLAELEARKREVNVGTDGFVTLAEEVERLARVVFRWSQAQLQLARDSQREGVAPTTINETAARPLDRILADWREAQLRLEGAMPGSREAEDATADVERLREEYRRGQDARR